MKPFATIPVANVVIREGIPILVTNVPLITPNIIPPKRQIRIARVGLTPWIMSPATITLVKLARFAKERSNSPTIRTTVNPWEIIVSKAIWVRIFIKLFDSTKPGTDIANMIKRIILIF